MWVLGKSKVHEMWRKGLCFGMFKYTSARVLSEIWSIRMDCMAFWEHGYYWRGGFLYRYLQYSEVNGKRLPEKNEV